MLLTPLLSNVGASTEIVPVEPVKLMCPFKVNVYWLMPKFTSFAETAFAIVRFAATAKIRTPSANVRAPVPNGPDVTVAPTVFGVESAFTINAP